MNLKLFKNKNFSLFVFGQSTSTLGTGFLNVSLAIYVYALTGSAAKFASILALAIVPRIFLGPFIGTIVERLDRKKMIVFMDLIRGVFALGLFVGSLFVTLPLWSIYLTVMFYSTCQAFFIPAFIKILPGILSKDDLVDGNSLQSTIDQTALAISPVLGTLIYTVAGISTIFLLDGLTYIISGISEIFMDVPPQQKGSKKISFFQDVVDGFKIIFVDVRITSLISNGILTHMFLFPFTSVGFPFIILQVLQGQKVDYGLTESLATIGSILAIFFVSAAKKRFNVAQCIGIGILGMLFFVFLMLPLSNASVLGMLNGNSTLIRIFFSSMSFVLYLSFSFYGVFYVTFYQTTLPENYLGRYTALQSLFFSLGRMLGLNVYGFLFDNFPLIVPMAVLGVGMFLKLVVHIPFMRATKRIVAFQVG